MDSDPQTASDGSFQNIEPWTRCNGASNPHHGKQFEISVEVLVRIHLGLNDGTPCTPTLGSTGTSDTPRDLPRPARWEHEQRRRERQTRTQSNFIRFPNKHLEILNIRVNSCRPVRGFEREREGGGGSRLTSFLNNHRLSFTFII